MSRYAEKNDREMWAEAFASHTPGKQQQKVVKRLKTLLELMDERKWIKDFKWLKDIPDDQRDRVIAELNALQELLEL